MPKAQKTDRLEYSSKFFDANFKIFFKFHLTLFLEKNFTLKHTVLGELYFASGCEWKIWTIILNSNKI